MNRYPVLVLAGLLLAASPVVGGQPEESAPVLRFRDSPDAPDFGDVVVFGLPAADLAQLLASDPEIATWERLLAIRARSRPPAGSLPPVLGSYTVAGGELRFRPRFHFQAGLELEASFDGPLLDRLLGKEAGAAITPRLELAFAMPRPAAGPPTRVEAVYPSADTVPENLLRLYVHFSAPMRPKDVAKGVRLLDESGAEIELPFVEVEDGLWDPQARRLTLFFHPGRIKRGVGPRVAMGSVLENGRRYRLVVDRELRDAAGAPLAASFETTLVVGPADRRSPDPASWRVRPPAGPDDELAIDFGESLDRALVERLIEVFEVTGEPVAGAAAASRSETRWSFSPAVPWRSGRYLIRVNSALEDMAGNTLSRRFDEEVVEGRAAAEDGPPYRDLVFEVGDPD